MYYVLFHVIPFDFIFYFTILFLVLIFDLIWCDVLLCDFLFALLYKKYVIILNCMMISFCSIVYYINMLLNPIIFIYIYMYIILGMIGDAALFFSTLFPLNPVVYGLPSIKLT